MIGINHFNKGRLIHQKNINTMFGFVTIPSAADMITSSTAYSSGFFATFLELIWIPIGITIVIAVIALIRRSISRGVRGVTGGRRGRRRR